MVTMKSSTFKATLSIVIICILFIAAQVTQVSAFSVRELLGLGKPAEDKAAQQQSATSTDKDKSKQNEWSKTADDAKSINPQISLEHIGLLMDSMNQQERDKILAEPELFAQLVENEANNRSTISAAISNKLEQDRQVRFLMKRGAENILRESYLNRLIASKLPEGFPSDEQVAEYYQNNKEKFVVPERIHVWQIFYRKTDNADSKQIDALKKKATTALNKLKNNKADFASLALAESEHEQSRALGGYMGLININELLPEMKQPLLDLKEGELSKPVESESGIHILKRGEIQQAQTVELAQVEDQIRKLLINQANAQLRNAIYVQARKEFPQDLSDKKIEEWRIRLRTSTN